MRLIHLRGPAHACTKAATKLPCSSHGATSELPATRGEVGPWTPWRGCHLGLISGTDKVRVEIKGFERWAVEVEVVERVDYLDSDGEMYRG